MFITLLGVLEQNHLGSYIDEVCPTIDKLSGFQSHSAVDVAVHKIMYFDRMLGLVMHTTVCGGLLGVGGGLDDRMAYLMLLRWVSRITSLHAFVYLNEGRTFPGFVASFFSRLSWASTGGSSPTVSNRNVIGSVPSFGGREVQGNRPSAPPAFTMEPPEDSIATLVSMGFDRNTARQALIQARNDINTATNILLEAQSH
ncbi:Ubiquitin-associated domain/translation elongation factor EF-Ts [Macleaya cordata]|uniref:Ubiquitin-associated domain/translation elongation factor EF-Ts n=1 Tax=Macleaya cordata TaxID=56857 RepID=A0A200PUW4_MACCD|nr:Ubiquitin-associated domain/translation elongation factor EF-Ts [Macleaya cordata]